MSRKLRTTFWGAVSGLQPMSWQYFRNVSCLRRYNFFVDFLMSLSIRSFVSWSGDFPESEILKKKIGLCNRRMWNFFKTFLGNFERYKSTLRIRNSPGIFSGNYFQTATWFWEHFFRGVTHEIDLEIVSGRSPASWPKNLGPKSFRRNGKI